MDPSVNIHQIKYWLTLTEVKLFFDIPHIQDWGVRAIAHEVNCLSVRVRVWVRVSFRDWGQFSLRVIVLEPKLD